MRIAVVGTGYVGLVTGVCLAKLGHHVTMIDKDADKIDTLSHGKVTFYEPGLEELIRECHPRLTFTTAISMVRGQHAAIIAVGTPAGGNVKDEMNYFYEAVGEMSCHLDCNTKVIIKSTVLPGTNDNVRAMLPGCDVISNPEFLREGSAIKDTLEPDRIVIGVRTRDDVVFMRELYAGISTEIVKMQPRSAEMVKHASNAFLAMKISFINEMAVICEKAGADIYEVRQGMCRDKRIGWQFLMPGVGYGGSCFPKDVTALARYADSLDIDPLMLDAIDERNEEQKYHMVNFMSEVMGDLFDRKIAVLGLAFKPNTDDTREAPSLTLLRCLDARVARVKVHDPKATVDGFTQCKTIEATLHDVEAVVIMTEWPEYGLIPRSLLEGKYIFDGRGLFHDHHISMMPNYYCIGRAVR